MHVAPLASFLDRIVDKPLRFADRPPFTGWPGGAHRTHRPSSPPPPSFASLPARFTTGGQTGRKSDSTDSGGASGAGDGGSRGSMVAEGMAPHELQQRFGVRLQALKAHDLKELLKVAGQDTRGTRAQLIDRLLGVATSNSIIRSEL